MLETVAFKEARKNNSKLYFQPDGTLYGMNPAESMFGYTYHSHMIPPFKPESVLILGYGYGTVANLMRKIWGSDLKVTGVDIGQQAGDYIEYKQVRMDARDFVKDCSTGLFKKKFDYIVVDLFGAQGVPDFVFSVEFAVRLRSICKKLISINTEADEFKRLKPYHEYGFTFDRHVQIEDNIVSFWSVIQDEEK